MEVGAKAVVLVLAKGAGVKGEELAIFGPVDAITPNSLGVPNHAYLTRIT